MYSLSLYFIFLPELSFFSIRQTKKKSDRACCTTSCPGPCHFQARLLQCSVGWTSIKHNQTSTNDSECSGTTGLQRAQKSPCYTSLCLLALATSCLMLAYRTTTGSAPTYFHSLLWIYIPSRSPSYFHSLLWIYIPSRSPSYFHSLLWIYIPSRSLRSASERRLVVPSQRGSKSLPRTFSFTVPGRWNDLPTPIRNAGSLSIFKQQLKTHLFIHYFTSS